MIPAEPPGHAASRLFGTDGIRGVVGKLYTPAFVADIAAAYATWLRPPGVVLVGWDFRTTSVGIAHILSGTFQMLGLQAIEMGPMPTPCFQFNVRGMGARGGLMVTASHNPTDFNGIKFAGGDGLEIPPEAEALIEKIFHERAFLRPRWEDAGSLRTDSGGVDRYLASIEAHVEAGAIRQRRLSVVLDPGNGTSAVTSPRLLRELGCKLVTLNANPDGGFPGRPSEPSEENLVDLRRSVPQIGADLGIAHDGDSDRVGFVDEKGTYLSGDVVLALFARYMLRKHPGAQIATSITTSSVVADVVAREGGHLVVTKSGSLPVALGVARNQAVFGGEENGHCYWPTHQNAPDGPMTSAMMLELLVREGRPLSELVAEIPAYHLLKGKVAVEPQFKDLVLDHARGSLEAEAEHIDTTDGVKAFFSDGWLLIRPSGTEPLIRVFAESRDPGRVQSLVDRGRALIQEALDGAPPRPPPGPPSGSAA